MNHSIRTDLNRRNLLLLTGALMIPGVASIAASNSATIGYFATLRRVAGLEPLSLHIKLNLRQKPVNAISELQRWSAPSALWIKTVVGDQWETLHHTIPTLVDDDLMAGQTREVMGLYFTATELALLLTTD